MLTRPPCSGSDRADAGYPTSRIDSMNSSQTTITSNPLDLEQWHPFTP